MRKSSLKIIALLLTVVLIVVGCGSTGKAENGATGLYKAGTYTAVAQGKNGDIKVEVTFTNDAIENIKVLEHHETTGTSDAAFERVPASIVEGQSLVVDSVSGATATQDAILKAVEECVLQAGGNVAALKTAKQTDKTTETLETDVVVIGSGLSGMSTAISAVQNGAKVIVVEKQAAPGRTFVTSYGNVMMAQVEEDKEYHKTESDDTLEQALERWNAMTNQGGNEDIAYPDYDRVKEIIVESGPTIGWMEDLGIQYQLSFTKEQRGADIVKPVQVGEQRAGLTVIETMAAKLEEYGGTILTDTKATELIEQDGSIVGIKAESSNKAYEIKAKSVVLATGGFGGNEDYVKELIPDIVNVGYQFTGTGANTGDGMTMAKEVGAAMYEDGWIIPSPGKLLPSKVLTDLNVDFTQLNGTSSLEGGVTDQLMLVNKEGNRMTNEAGQGVVIAADLIDGQQAPYYILFDSSSKDVVSILETGLESGDVFKADSIQELAKASQMSNLVATFNNYLQMAKAGKDTEFNKPAEMLKAYAEEGPYYLVKFVPDFVATMGGVKTNDDCQVVREDGTAIEGLYAVGEVTHRFLYNRAHFGNASNSASLTMGRLTGEMLAKHAQSK